MPDASPPPPPSIVHLTSGSFTGSNATLDIPPTSNYLVAILTSDVRLSGASVNTDANGGWLQPWLYADAYSCGHYVEIDVLRFMDPGWIAHQVSVTLDAPATFTIDVLEIANVIYGPGGGETSTRAMDVVSAPELTYRTSSFGIASVATCGELVGLVQPTPWMLVRPNTAVLIAPEHMTSAASWALTAPADSDAFAVELPPQPLPPH